MLVVSLAMVAILSSAPNRPDPSKIIDELGSPRYARREAAGLALEKMGREAIPALKVARESRNPEVQARASAILARIGDGQLFQPSLIEFDFRDEPLADAIAAINARYGLNLALTPGSFPIGARLTCRTAGPVPFWSAIDAVCVAGPLHHPAGTSAIPDLGGEAFPLVPGDATAPELVSDSGPFRVQLASIHFQSDLPLSRASAERRGSGLVEWGSRSQGPGRPSVLPPSPDLGRAPPDNRPERPDPNHQGRGRSRPFDAGLPRFGRDGEFLWIHGDQCFTFAPGPGRPGST